MNKKQEQMAGACYTVIAGKKASATGHVIVGHNEDDGGRCIFRYGMVPAADWPEERLCRQKTAGQFLRLLSRIFLRWLIPMAIFGEKQWIMKRGNIWVCPEPMLS